MAASLIILTGAIVVSQIGPAVIYANVAAGYFGEWNGGRESEPGVSFMRSQILAVCNLENVAVVIPASNFEMRSAKNVHLQL
jgi:hypothetical protein